MRVSGDTALYDALDESLRKIKRGKYQKKAILLITDGVDNSSNHTLSEAVEAAKRSRVAVYTVGLLSVSGGLTMNAVRRLIE